MTPVKFQVLLKEQVDDLAGPGQERAVLRALLTVAHDRLREYGTGEIPSRQALENILSALENVLRDTPDGRYIASRLRHGVKALSKDLRESSEDFALEELARGRFDE